MPPAPAAPIVARELSRSEELEEAWFLGLRLREGVRWSALPAGKDDVMAFHPIVEELCGLDLLSNDGQAVRLTPRGMLLSNEVFTRFLDVHQSANCWAPAAF